MPPALLLCPITWVFFLLALSGSYVNSQSWLPDDCDAVCIEVNENPHHLRSVPTWYGSTEKYMHVLQLMDGVRSYWLQMGSLYWGREKMPYFEHHWRVYILPESFYNRYDDMSKVLSEGEFHEYEKFFEVHNTGGVLLDMILGDKIRTVSKTNFATVLFASLGYDTLFYKAGEWFGGANVRLTKQQMHEIFGELEPLFHGLGITELRAADNGKLECKYHAQDLTLTGKAMMKLKEQASHGLLKGPEKYSYAIGQSILRIFDPEHFDDPYLEFGFKAPAHGEYSELDVRELKEKTGKTLTPQQMRVYEKIFTTKSFETEVGKAQGKLGKGKATWGSLCQKMRQNGVRETTIREMTKALLDTVPELPPPPEHSQVPKLAQTGTAVLKGGKVVVQGVAGVLQTGIRATKLVLAAPIVVAPKVVRKAAVRTERKVVKLSTENVLSLGVQNLFSWNEHNIDSMKLPDVFKRLWYGGERGCRNIKFVLEVIRDSNAYPALNKLIDARQHLRMEVPPLEKIEPNDVLFGRDVGEHKFDDWKRNEEGSEWTTMATVMSGLVMLTACCLLGLLFGLLCGCMGGKVYVSRWLTMKNGLENEDRGQDVNSNEETDEIVDVD